MSTSQNVSAVAPVTADHADDAPKFDYVVVVGPGSYKDDDLPVPEYFDTPKEYSRHSTPEAALADRDLLEDRVLPLLRGDDSAMVVVMPHVEEEEDEEEDEDEEQGDEGQDEASESAEITPAGDDTTAGDSPAAAPAADTAPSDSTSRRDVYHSHTLRSDDGHAYGGNTAVEVACREIAGASNYLLAVSPWERDGKTFVQISVERAPDFELSAETISATRRAVLDGLQGIVDAIRANLAAMDAERAADLAAA